MDGATEDKTFAPGYGEFSAGGGGDLEAVALAVPVDAVGGAPPAELGRPWPAAPGRSFDAAGSGRWAAASTERQGHDRGLAAGRPDRDLPELLAEQMTTALDALAKAVGDRDPARARQAALRAEQAALDLELRHRDPAEVDLERLDLWARQLQVDAAAKDRGAVAGDVAILQIIWDRVGHTAAPAAAERVGADLAALAKTTDGKDLRAAAAAVSAFRESLSAVRP